MDAFSGKRRNDRKASFTSVDRKNLDQKPDSNRSSLNSNHTASLKRQPGDVAQGRMPFVQRALGNRAFKGMIQAKTTTRNKGRGNQEVPVSEPGDALEQEADKTADRVMRSAGIDGISSQPVGPVFRKASENTSVGNRPLASQLHASRGSGRPLQHNSLSFMNNAFGVDFSTVRIHTGGRAREMSESIRAKAFTYGENIYFNNGQFAPDTSAGKRLLAHELTHVLQQKGTSPHFQASPPILARTPDDDLVEELLSNSTTESFTELWRQFSLQMPGPASAADRDLARRTLNALRATASLTETQTHGLTLATWFFEQGMHTEGRDALNEVERAWILGAVIQNESVPQGSYAGLTSTGPAALIQQAEQLARNGQHQLAFRLFGLAFFFLQIQVVQATERRAANLQNAAAAQVASTTRSMFVYPTIQSIYDQMRDILGFYFVLEQEATAAGNSQEAGQMNIRATQLRQHIQSRYMWSGEAMISEVTQVQTPMGPGLRLHGANGDDTDLTTFRGLPTPEEIGDRSYQWQSLEGIENSLWGQVEFLGELQRHAEIRNEFNGQEIDMNNLSHRLRVWRTMYNVFVQQSSTSPLGDLMEMIGRYLRAFTLHTRYNIRDWGQNYLTSDFPVDLAGRAARDCGVYALTVAYEVFRTARSASPRLNLEFEITVVPSHVMLVIYDIANNSFYVVNNDQVSPSRTGGRPEAEGAIASAAAGVFGRHNYVTPAIRRELGSTRLSTGGFRNQAWSRYREASGWNLAPAPRQGPGDTRTDAELAEEGSRLHHERQEQYDQRATRLIRAIMQLNTDLASLNPQQQLDRLQAEMPTIGTAARQLAGLASMLGRNAPIVVDQNRPHLIGVLAPLRRFLYAWRPEGASHPLVRVAKALLRMQHLGGTLSADDTALIAFCDSIGGMRADLDQYRQAGFPPGF